MKRYKLLANMRGLTGPGSRHQVGDEVVLQHEPDAADLVYLEEVLSDEVQALELGNAQALLIDERERRRAAEAARDELVRRADRLGARIVEVENANTAQAKRIELLEQQVEQRDAEIAALRDAQAVADLGQPWADVPAKTALAFANRQRVASDLEPFGGRGASERAIEWLNTDVERFARAWQQEQGEQ